MSATAVVRDGTGIEWRMREGVVQHRYGASCFGPDGKPGPWIDTPDVERIVHPARTAALAALRTWDAGTEGGGSDGQ